MIITGSSDWTAMAIARLACVLSRRAARGRTFAAKRTVHRLAPDHVLALCFPGRSDHAMASTPAALSGHRARLDGPLGGSDVVQCLKMPDFGRVTSPPFDGCVFRPTVIS